MTQSSNPKLSICIGTFNRGAFIGATLESIISQAPHDCEIVVSDNASTDDTEEVVARYARSFDRLRYFKQVANNGIDRNFDDAVELARGKYCWLMTDDDLMKPNAMNRVMEAIQKDFSLIMVNVEVMNFNMTQLVRRSLINFESDRIYEREDLDRLFIEADDDLAMYIGSVIIKRSIWRTRQRERYYGCLFIHTAVIFQAPLPGRTLLIAEPLISYRQGNAHSYSDSVAEVLYVRWPVLIESMVVSDSAKRKFKSAQPWRRPGWLLLLRGWGYYSLAEYRRWVRPRLDSLAARLSPILVALLPGVLVNTMFVICYSVRHDRKHFLPGMMESRFHLRNWIALRRP